MDNNGAPQFTPAQATTAPTTEPATATRDKRQLVWGLVCLIGPTALIVISILIYGLVSFIATSSAGPAATDGLFNSPPIGVRIMNIILFIVGAIATLTWLPGIVVGIILLATRKK